MPKRLSICIGINTYQHIPALGLKYACSDAEEVASLLIDNQCGKFDNVFRLLDAEATRANIISALKATLLDLDLRAEDLVLIFSQAMGQSTPQTNCI